MEKEFNDYKLLKILKKNDISTVYLATRDNTSFKYAVKRINLSKINEEKIKDLENDCNFYLNFNSKFVLKLYNAYQGDDDDFNIITEYCDGGFLSDFLYQTKKEKKTLIKEELIWKIFIQISLGLHEIHSKNIIHRNLKPETILLFKDFTAKIKNFKSAKKLNSEFTKTFIGSPYYISPEIYENKPYNKKTDIWSLGIILYEMCMLNKPFKANNEDELKKKVIKEKYKPIDTKYSKELVNMINMLLVKNPEKRPSIDDIIQNYIFIGKAKLCNLLMYVKMINPDNLTGNKAKNNMKNKNKEKHNNQKKDKRNDITKVDNKNNNNNINNNKIGITQFLGNNISDTTQNITNINQLENEFNNNKIGITQFLGNNISDTTQNITNINQLENEFNNNKIGITQFLGNNISDTTQNFTNINQIEKDSDEENGYDENNNLTNLLNDFSQNDENNKNKEKEEKVKYTSEQKKLIKEKMNFIQSEIEKLIGKHKTKKLILEANNSNLIELSSQFKTNSEKINAHLKNYIFYKNKL